MTNKQLHQQLCKLAIQFAHFDRIFPAYSSPIILFEQLVAQLPGVDNLNRFMNTHNYNPTDFNDEHYYIPEARTPIPGDLIMFKKLMYGAGKLGVITAITEETYTVVRLCPVEHQNKFWYQAIQETILKTDPTIGIFYSI